MLFSEYVEQKEGKPFQNGVAEKLNELQESGQLEATVLLSGQVWLTERYLEYKNLA